MSVAQTILSQLGGNKFLAMTGAKDLVDLGNGLQMKLPRIPGIKINSVRITLDATDTYTVIFGRMGRVNYRFDYKVISKFSDIYAEDLQDLFVSETGLLVRL